MKQTFLSFTKALSIDGSDDAGQQLVCEPTILEKVEVDGQETNPPKMEMGQYMLLALVQRCQKHAIRE